jgi:hypothetical protein
MLGTDALLAGAPSLGQPHAALTLIAAHLAGVLGGEN